jgi:hypothetical protein
LGIVDGGDVDAIVELLLVAHKLQDLGNHGAVHDHVVLAEICQRLNAGTITPLEAADHLG